MQVYNQAIPHNNVIVPYPQIDKDSANSMKSFFMQNALIQNNQSQHFKNQQNDIVLFD